MGREGNTGRERIYADTQIVHYRREEDLHEIFLSCCLDLVADGANALTVLLVATLVSSCRVSILVLCRFQGARTQAFNLA